MSEQSASDTPPTSTDSKKSKPLPIPEERTEITVHRTTLDGAQIAYTATAGARDAPRRRS